MIPYVAFTPTGDRQRLLDLCSLWISRQTWPPAVWLIVDDGLTPVSTKSFRCPASLPILHVRRFRGEKEPAHTLPLNVQKALPAIQELERLGHSRFVIFEDDDWYAPAYAENLVSHIPENGIAGYCNTMYYRFAAEEWLLCGNRDRASFCETAFHSGTRLMLNHAACHCLAGSHPFVDLLLWTQSVPKSHQRIISHPLERLHVGMKCLPGRSSSTSGHVSERGFRKDRERRMLHRLIGEDIRLYEDLLRAQV